MTDSLEECVDSTPLVNVRAQVMVRDDSTGGWVPLGGGGLANVSVRKYAIPGDTDELNYEYLIFGKRILDQAVVLNCIIKKDFEYNKVMPTFHHWKTGEKKFGLTFQTAADARAFDKGLRIAVNELLDGIAEGPNARKSQGGELSDEEAVEFPVEQQENRSSPASSTQGNLQFHQTTSQDEVSQVSHFFGRSKLGSEPESPTQSDKYPYLQMTDVHEYLYPDEEGTKLVPHEPTDSQKKTTMETPLSAPAKTTRNERRIFGSNRCRYCQELYLEEENRKGACEYAPDFMRTAVDELSCIRCARCMLYHCMSDEEGDFAQHPCDCNSEEGCGRRWMGLALLSIFVPCLWFYPPMRACHRCCIRCGLCGGRHRTAS